jgi:hypothetical protein
MRQASVLLLILAAVPMLHAQQVSDDAFRFENARPAYHAGEGPRVCIDEAHNNFHTADGRYRPFAELLRSDGFRVSGSTGKIVPSTLAACDVLVISNAIADENAGTWAFPHPSAFTRTELEAVYQWIRGGGALLFIVDHAPMAGAASDLGTMLGVVMLDGYVRGAAGAGPDIFGLEGGLQTDHAIVRGRSADERVTRVATFTGLAFHASDDFAPILRFGAGAEATVDLGLTIQGLPADAWPRISVSGWLHAASRRLGDGRVVLLGEAAMCTAQLAGPQRNPMGMNHPEAAQNAQFCLNTVRWLSGALAE